jgi:hypothetical protein
VLNSTVAICLTISTICANLHKPNYPLAKGLPKEPQPIAASTPLPTSKSNQIFSTANRFLQENQDKRTEGNLHKTPEISSRAFEPSSISPVDLQEGSSSTPSFNSSSFLLAAPENLNPGLAPPPPPSPEPAEEGSDSFVIQLESLDVNFQNDASNYGQVNRIFEPSFQFRINDEIPIRFTTGLNRYDRPNEEAIANIPLRIGWEGEVGDINVTANAGIEFYDHQSPQFSVGGSAAIPILPGVTLTPMVDYSPYKFNVTTIDNNTYRLNFGTSLYWQIDSQTSLFSLLRFGAYNDSNFEQQSFSRLEHRVGDFSVAANLFNWSYTQDRELQSGYFSPPDFLVYSGEIAWNVSPFEPADCRLSSNFGQQRLEGEWTIAYGFQTRCGIAISNDVELNLSYTFDNVRNRQTGGSAYNNSTISGGLRVNF